MDYQRESDARIVIDDLLRKAGRDPADKSMVETEVLVLKPGEAGRDSVATPNDASPSAGRDTFGRADHLLRDQHGRALAVIEARNMDEAVGLLSKAPCAHAGAYEPRPLA